MPSLIGNKPNQVPSNGDLGTLAFQDANSVNITGGMIDVNAGSATTASLGAAGDADTGLFFPAANTVAVTTGGTERARLDSSGNLGIGTGSPGAKLDVAASSGTLGNFQANFGGAGGLSAVTIKTNTSVSSGLTLRGNGSGATIFGGALAASVFNAENAALLFGTNNTERARIDSSGNFIHQVNGSAPTLATNSTMSFELTSNTSLKIVVRGTDGVTRSANITLA